MGLEAWLKQNTKSGSQHSEALISHLGWQLEYLAASMVAYSGHQSWSATGARLPNQIVFMNHFEMEVAGYEPVTKDMVELVNPSITDMQKEELYGAAYQAFSAYLSIAYQNAARKNMDEENALTFSNAIDSSIAEICAGRFGFDIIPQNTFERIGELIPRFLNKNALSVESPGIDDALGNIFLYLSRSSDGKTRYSFVVGSKVQILGFVTPYLRILTLVEELCGAINEELP